MKRELILSAAILSLLAVAPAYSQEQEKEKPQESKPAQEEHKPADTKKAPKQETKAPKDQQQSKEQQKQDEKSAKQQQQTEKQQQPTKEQKQEAKQPKENDKNQKGVAKQQQQEEKQQNKRDQLARQQDQGNNQRQASGREAGRGQRIPDDRFREHFGREHHFRVARHGDNRFAYGGYTFEFLEPWPVGWAYTDDCYVEFIDGQYFLFDILHPDVRIAVIVVG